MSVGPEQVEAATLGVVPTRKPTRLYDYAAIAEATGIRPAILRVWNQRGQMPPADYIVGRSPAWLPATIEKWIEERKVPSLR